MEELQKIPLAAHESELSRMHKLVKILLIGWAVTLALALCVIYSYATSEYEVTTETTTTETVSQDGGEGGSNVYAGGDVVG